ncbi:MAG: glycoside hydrolase family 3 N-terminal domain-containing protein [Sulfurovum sp.]
MIKKILVVSNLLCISLFAQGMSIEKKIGQMLMVGFYGTSASPNSQICKDIKRYNLGGVILFDYNPTNYFKAKNISSKSQLKRLTKQLQACSRDGKLLIAIDQEGGKVQRLKRKYGFYGNFPKASDIKKMSTKQIKNTYLKMARELHSVGVNFNLAPVVDLDINPRNRVIHGLGRSFGKDPKKVAKYANIFIQAMNKYNVLTSIKHFPGHGSSLGDTHRGFVDVTKLWNKKELEPYKKLKNRADTIMVAHVFNKKIDSKYPASLSYKTINGLLRQNIGYNGVVITDDLQMGAISKKYGLKTTLALAIAAGDDILLIGNQLNPKRVVSTKRLVNTIKSWVGNNRTKMKMIDNSYRRIARLKKKI